MLLVSCNEGFSIKYGNVAAPEAPTDPLTLPTISPLTNTGSINSITNNQLVIARRNSPSVELPNGHVLVVGGYNVTALSSVEIYNPSTERVSAAASMSTERNSPVAFALTDGRAMVCGGTNAAGVCLSSCEIYDPTNNSWTAGNSLVTAVLVTAWSVKKIDNKVYVIGGTVLSPSTATIADVQIFDESTMTWTSGAPLPSPVESQAMVQYDTDTIYVIGGYDRATSTRLDSIYKYSISGNSWSTMATLISGRSSAAAAVLGSKILIVGGRNAAGTTNTSEVFTPDVGIGSLAAGPSVPNGASEIIAKALSSTSALVAGGVGPANATNIESGIIDIDAGTYVEQTYQMNEGLCWSNFPFFHSNGDIILLGGSTSNFKPSARIQRYLSTESKWYSPSPSTRSGHTSTKLDDGTVLVVGGTLLEPNLPTKSAEIFDPNTERWYRAGSLTVARNWHAIQKLLNGKVMAISGQSTMSITSTLTTADLYDPATNRWTVTGTFSQGRVIGKAALITTSPTHLGKVVFAGGWYNCGGFFCPSNVTNLYDPVLNTWTTKAVLNGARAQSAMLELSTPVASGHVMIVGGSAGGPALATNEIYDVDNNTWTTVAASASGMDVAATLLLTDGRILAQSGTASAIYNATANTWTSMGAITSTRVGSILMNVDANHVVVFAGTSVANAEILDIAGTTWTPVAGEAMSSALSGVFQAGVILDDGRVMLPAGGNSMVNNFFSIYKTTYVSTTDGTPPYTYSLVSGSGTVYPHSGLVVPSALGTIVVKSTDSTGRTGTVTITVQ